MNEQRGKEESHQGDLSTSQVALLTAEHVSKSFPGVQALDDVSIDIRPNEVHGLLGLNGSGKSTLIKVLAGVYKAEGDSSFFYNGEVWNPLKANSQVRFVHQDLGLVLELDAVDNLALRNGFARNRFGQVDWKGQRRYTREIFDQFNLDMDITEPLSKATAVQRTIVAIAAALQNWDATGGVLILDEPTAALPADEVGRLLQLIRDLKAAGAGILAVSHRLDELVGLADRATVLRDSRVAGSLLKEEITRHSMANLMVGEEFVSTDYESREKVSDASSALEVRNAVGRELNGVDLVVQTGEVIGLAGLAGSGAQELLYAIAGVSEFAMSGELRSPSTGMKWIPISEMGVGVIPLVPANRQAEGLIPDFSVAENLTLSALNSLRSRGFVSKRQETLLVDSWIERLGIVGAPDVAVTKLSGGNQQKVVVGRWLATTPKLIAMCEPSAGVDIAARGALHDVIRGLCDDGCTVIIMSTDLDELIHVCTRILVVRNGRIVLETDPQDCTEATLLQTMESELDEAHER